MTTIKPPALRKGDKIGIVSPSEPVIYPKRLKENLKIFFDLGLKAILGRNAMKRYGSYMAGTNKQRADDLNKMFADKKIEAIFCTRGGFSSNQILPLINFLSIKKNPKIFVGFSDITVLLNAVFTKTGLITFHWSNTELNRKKFKSQFKKIFIENFMYKKGRGDKIQINSKNILRKGRSSGRLVGGNLWALATLLGTDYAPNWRNKFFFWEETEMTSQEIDFLLNHFKLAGVFKKISGMVIGKLHHCDILKPDDDWSDKKPLSMDKIVLEITKEYKFPIIKNLDFGHASFVTQPYGLVLPIGVKATIDTSKKLFSIDENGVA